VTTRLWPNPAILIEADGREDVKIVLSGEGGRPDASFSLCAHGARELAERLIGVAARQYCDGSRHGSGDGGVWIGPVKARQLGEVGPCYYPGDDSIVWLVEDCLYDGKEVVPGAFILLAANSNRPVGIRLTNATERLASYLGVRELVPDETILLYRLIPARLTPPAFAETEKAALKLGYDQLSRFAGGVQIPAVELQRVAAAMEAATQQAAVRGSAR
jgi:hypothetical protein